MGGPTTARPRAMPGPPRTTGLPNVDERERHPHGFADLADEHPSPLFVAEVPRARARARAGHLPGSAVGSAGVVSDRAGWAIGFRSCRAGGRTNLDHRREHPLPRCGAPLRRRHRLRHVVASGRCAAVLFGRSPGTRSAPSRLCAPLRPRRRPPPSASVCSPNRPTPDRVTSDRSFPAPRSAPFSSTCRASASPRAGNPGPSRPPVNSSTPRPRRSWVGPGVCLVGRPIRPVRPLTARQ